MKQNEQAARSIRRMTLLCAVAVMAVMPVSVRAQDAVPPPAAPVLAPATNNAQLSNTLPPPVVLGPSGAANNNTSGSVLPDAGSVTARSPGLELPVGPGGDGAMATGLPQKTREEIEQELREDAFNASLTGLLPLEPPEIRRVLERYDRTQKAVETPIYEYPEPQVVVKTISLDPGVKPVEVKVATGHVTTINFVDVSGAPWPIQDVSWAGNFEIIQPEAGGNVLRITPMSEFAYGNISIRMVELKTPVTFVLRTHRDGVYYRMDARLANYGPMATPPIIDRGVTISAGNNTMTSILDGVPPQDATKLQVTGVDGQTTAFSTGGTTYLRTPLTLLSPSWRESVRSADGMNVYALDDAPVLLLSEKGRMVRAHLKVKEEKEGVSPWQ